VARAPPRGTNHRVAYYLACVECGLATAEFQRGWRGFLTDDEFSPAEVAILCPRCAEQESGPFNERPAVEDQPE
jgi:hypothetical protein